MAKARAGGPTKQYLTRDQLLNVLAVKTADLKLPDGSIIKVKGLAAASGIKAFQGGDEDPVGRMKRIMLLGIVEPQFSEEDIELLGDSSLGVSQQIVDKILELTGMTGSDEPEAFLDEARSSKISSITAPKSSDDSPAN